MVIDLRFTNEKIYIYTHNTYCYMRRNVCTQTEKFILVLTCADDEVFQLPVTPANTRHECAKVRTQKVLAKNAGRLQTSLHVPV